MEIHLLSKVMSFVKGLKYSALLGFLQVWSTGQRTGHDRAGAVPAWCRMVDMWGLLAAQQWSREQYTWGIGLRGYTVAPITEG